MKNLGGCMKRILLNYLGKWKDKKKRKPLVIRGARQVGKSYLVRLFAREYALELPESLAESDSWQNAAFPG